MVDFNKPPFLGKEQIYIQEAISKYHKLCGNGRFTKRCNSWMEEKFNISKVLLTTSCTHALEMAAILAEIRPGDEVIMPSYTFVSTANSFVMRGAKIIFVDIRPDTMNINENLIEDANK
jgi:dTDP-4-amino-4,6-dideoxygalactose transaminase